MKAYFYIGKNLHTNEPQIFFKFENPEHSGAAKTDMDLVATADHARIYSAEWNQFKQANPEAKLHEISDRPASGRPYLEDYTGPVEDKTPTQGPKGEKVNPEAKVDNPLPESEEGKFEAGLPFKGDEKEVADENKEASEVD